MSFEEGLVRCFDSFGLQSDQEFLSGSQKHQPGLQSDIEIPSGHCLQPGENTTIKDIKSQQRLNQSRMIMENLVRDKQGIYIDKRFT